MPDATPDSSSDIVSDAESDGKSEAEADAEPEIQSNAGTKDKPEDTLDEAKGKSKSGTGDEPEAKAAQETETEQEETPAFAKQDYYVVEPGESLLGISQKLYGRDYTRQLCELNELEDENKIYAGQKLLLLDK